MSTPERPAAGNGDESDVSIDVPLNVRNVALSVLAVLAGVLMLQYAQAVLIPIVLAVLISYAMGPAVAALERQIPRAIAAALVLLALMGVGGVATYELTDQVLQIAEQVPDAAARVRARMRETRRERGGALETVQRAATEVEKTATEASKPPPAPTGVQKVQIVQPAFSAGQYIRLGGIGLIGGSGTCVDSRSATLAAAGGRSRRQRHSRVSRPIARPPRSIRRRGRVSPAEPDRR
jgi:hypothetical protein